MSSRRRALPPADLVDLVARGPEYRTFHRADARCFHCGGLCGVMEAPRLRPLPGVVGYRRVEEAQARATDIRTLRCQRCGGPVYLDELEVVRQRVDHINWRLDEPRRGRPPKWLVELRNQDAA